MFFERLEQLCRAHDTNVTELLKTLGYSTSKGTAWRNGSVPKGDILLRLAAYFSVTTDYLLKGDGLKVDGAELNTLRIYREFIIEYQEKHAIERAKMSKNKKNLHMAIGIGEWSEANIVLGEIKSILNKDYLLTKQAKDTFISAQGEIELSLRIYNAMKESGNNLDNYGISEDIGNQIKHSSIFDLQRIDAELAAIDEAFGVSTDYLLTDAATIPKSEEADKLKIPPSLEGALVAFHRKQGDFTKDELEQIEIFVDLLAARRSRKKGD